MTYFLLVLQALIIGVLLCFHHKQTQDWREERAHLLHAAMAKSLPELQSQMSAAAGPIVHNWAEPEDSDFAVGL